MTNQENMTKWVQALRSGEYKQTTGQLKDVNGYCCLGVLCDVSGLGQWQMDESGHAIYNDGSRSLNSAGPPRKVIEWLSVGEADLFGDGDLILDGEGPDGLGGFTCIHANDTQNMSFDEIAAWIEKRYLNEDH